jgi:hypothetical protein
MAAYRLPAASLDLVAAYEGELWDIGQRPDHKVLWGARYFCARIGDRPRSTRLRCPSSSA